MFGIPYLIPLFDSPKNAGRLLADRTLEIGGQRAFMDVSADRAFPALRLALLFLVKIEMGQQLLCGLPREIFPQICGQKLLQKLARIVALRQHVSCLLYTSFDTARVLTALMAALGRPWLFRLGRGGVIS